MLFAPALTALFAQGSSISRTSVANSELVRITFPYLGLISLTAYAAALLNAHGYFALPAVTPVLLNVCLMLAAMVAIFGWVDAQPVVIVAWGVMVAGIVQLSVITDPRSPRTATTAEFEYQAGRRSAGWPAAVTGSICRVSRANQCVGEYDSGVHTGVRRYCSCTTQIDCLSCR